ncbi:MAG: hydroxymethylbilane synthase [Weeksellaceae bacterium]
MKIKIGTRKSPLAMWQAYQAQDLLQSHGYQTEIIPISSEGDLKLSEPIYELGITGVFTKTLDIALVNQQVDVAVHSLKDVPTKLAKGLHLTACLERGDHRDILVYKSDDIFTKDHRTIATGSLRRRAFWWNQYPQDKVVDLRGNVQLRLQKLLDNAWDGAIFAYAGLNRSEILQELNAKGLKYQFLENMIAAPSQGIVGIVARQDLDLNALSNPNAETAAKIERAFLRKLQGGCTAPIGGHAQVTTDGLVEFNGAVLSLDGKKKISVSETRAIDNPERFGEEMAEVCIAQGGDDMIQEIKVALNK